MTHIDDHTLEKYLFNSDEVRKLRTGIEKHLDKCYGCRETLERIRHFYVTLDERLQNISEKEISSETSLARIEDRVVKRDPSHVEVFGQQSLTVWEKIFYTVRKHPLVSGSVSIALGAVIFAVVSLFSPKTKDTMPHDFYADYQKNLVIVRNKNYEDLWKISSPNLQQTLGRQNKFDQQFILADLDNDGSKELISSAPIGQNETNDSPKLHVFNSDGSLRFEYVPPETISFRGTVYRQPFRSNTISIIHNQESNRTMIALFSTNSHSPSIISLLDPRGKVVGEYFHYGNFSTSYVDTLRDGRQVLLVTGSCDMDEILHNRYESHAVLVVLDPALLNSECEASYTRGFGPPASKAELYYIRFPWTDIDLALGHFRAGASIFSFSKSGLVIRATAENTRERNIFDYSLNNNLIVAGVNLSDGTYQLHEVLKKAGKIKSTINSDYLNNLKKQVDYWDGKGWTKTVSLVNNE